MGTKNYELYHRFIGKFLLKGGCKIDPEDPLVAEVEQETESNDQVILTGDMMNYRFTWCSRNIDRHLNITPVGITPVKMFRLCHPDDVERIKLGRIKLLQLAHDLFNAKNGVRFISIIARFRNPEGSYTRHLLQLCLYYVPEPEETVALFYLITDIKRLKIKNSLRHFSLREDLSLFRYPDRELLAHGNQFSDREYQVIRLVANGLPSEQIARQLSLSICTINAHRANILKKSGKNTILDLILEMKQQGIV
jgi:DNA-binding CsgD family transcriptional regulator